MKQAFVAKIVPYLGTTSSNKNGEKSIFMDIIAGTAPNRQVMDGTVARMRGAELGNTYYVTYKKMGHDLEHGDVYTFTFSNPLNPLEVDEFIDRLGEPNVFLVEKPEISEKYQRQSTAVEGLLSVRQREGKFIPAFQTTPRDHSNAKVIQGSSLESDTDLGLSKKEKQKALDESEGQQQKAA